MVKLNFNLSWNIDERFEATFLKNQATHPVTQSVIHNSPIYMTMGEYFYDEGGRTSEPDEQLEDQY